MEHTIMPSRICDASVRKNSAFIILPASAIILLTYLIIFTSTMILEPAFRENQAKAKGWRTKWEIHPRSIPIFDTIMQNPLSFYIG
jgi:hypothetical protein